MGTNTGILNIDNYFITIWGSSAITRGNNRIMWRYDGILIELFIDMHYWHIWKKIWRGNYGDVLYVYMFLLVKNGCMDINECAITNNWFYPKIWRYISGIQYGDVGYDWMCNDIYVWNINMPILSPWHWHES